MKIKQKVELKRPFEEVLTNSLAKNYYYVRSGLTLNRRGGKWLTVAQVANDIMAAVGGSDLSLRKS